MIGIDVVDLKDPLLKPRDRSHLRFINHRNENLNKFTSKVTPNQIYWIYWSAKEAVFKYYRMEESFDPKQIQIQIQSISFGPEIEINFKSEHVSGKVYLNNSRAIAIAYQVNNPPPVWQLFDLSDKEKNESKVLRELSIIFLYADHQLLGDYTESKIPAIKDQKSNETYPVSLSHHNRYGAFAIVLN